MLLPASEAIIAILHYCQFDVIAESFTPIFANVGRYSELFFCKCLNIFLIKGHNDLDKGRLFLLVDDHKTTRLIV